MSDTVRFGKKLPVPSTAQIKHELRLMAASRELVDAGIFEGQRAGTTEQSRHDLACGLSRRHGLSVDRAQMLVERFESNRHTLAIAVQQLTTGSMLP